MVHLLETIVYEGKEYVAVVVRDPSIHVASCGGCVFREMECLSFKCQPEERDDGKDVIFLAPDVAVLARLRGTVT